MKNFSLEQKIKNAGFPWVTGATLVLLLMGALSIFQKNSEANFSTSSYNYPDFNGFKNSTTAMCGTFFANGDEVRAIKSGNWNDETIWDSGKLPENGDEVIINSGVRVTINRNEPARLKHLSIDGELIFCQNAQSELLVETILVNGSGAITIGTKSNPFPETSSAKIIFIDNGALPDLRTDERGIVVLGKFNIYGTKKEPFLNAGDAPAGSNSINISGLDNSDWQVGDYVVIPSVVYNPGEINLVFTGDEISGNKKPSRESIKNTFQDEKVRITEIRNNTITFTPALSYDHVRPKADLPYHVANLSRNIVFESEAEQDVKRRGHAMFMQGSQVHIQGARFHRLGRTDKRGALDDLKVNTRLGSGPRGHAIRKSDPKTIKNARGRYAVHFHRMGANRQDVNKALSTVINCVVEDTPGWGYVNHSSHVDFTDNVCFNFTGAGFVTELGDEIGTFNHNIAIQGHGNGELRERRLGFNMKGRMPVLNDFGFGGDGFWFQGSAVYVTNNVSISCNGSGIIWFSTGGVRDELISYNEVSKSRIAGIKAELARKLYPTISSNQIRPRKVKLPAGEEEELVLSDIPILQCEGNTAYACHIGLNTRFCNNTNQTFYRQFKLNYHLDFTSENLKRGGQNVKNQVLWNNYLALSSSYTSSTTFDNIEIYNGLRRSYVNDGNIVDFGIQGEHSNGLVFKNTTLEGYGLGAIWQRSASKFTDKNLVKETALIENRLHLKNNNTPVSNIEVTDVESLGDFNKRIRFNADSDQKSVAIRYKAKDDRFWAYKRFNTSSNNVTVEFPKADQDYDFELLRAGSNTTSKEWSDMMTSEASVVTSLNNNLVEEPKLMIYPNPSTSVINLSEEVSWTLTTLEGKEILKGDETQIVVSNLPSGIYLLITELGVKRIVVE